MRAAACRETEALGEGEVDSPGWAGWSAFAEEDMARLKDAGEEGGRLLRSGIASGCLLKYLISGQGRSTHGWR